MAFEKKLLSLVQYHFHVQVQVCMHPIESLYVQGFLKPFICLTMDLKLPVFFAERFAIEESSEKCNFRGLERVTDQSCLQNGTLSDTERSWSIIVKS